jgi:PAS domain S-box-containing protein
MQPTGSQGSHPTNHRMTTKAFLVYLVVGILGLNLFIISLAWYSLAKSRRQYTDQAAVNAQNLAQVLEQNISGTISRVDVVVRMLAREAEHHLAGGKLDAPRLETFIASAGLAFPELDGFRVADAAGFVLAGLNASPSHPINIADRPYFIQLRDQPTLPWVLSKPVKGRVAGRWVIVVGRRIHRPDGGFGGVALAAIPLQMIDTLFARIQVGKYGAFALRDGRDLALVARYPEPEGLGSAIGHKKMSQEFLALLEGGATVGSYAAPSGLDQRVRTWAYRKFGDGLFFIFVGLARDEYLADWRREFLFTGLSLGFFFLLSLGMGAVMFLNWRRGREVEESLRANDARVRLFFERQIVGMGITNADGHWVEVNDRWCQITGYGRAELKDLGWNTLAHADDRSRSLALYDQLLSGQIDDFALTQRILRKDGAVLVVELSVGCVRNEDGTLNGLLALMEDVSAQKESEAELKRLEHQLQHAQKLESLGSLAGGVAHDMNNVLGAILGLASSNLEAQPEGSRAYRAFDTISQAARRGGQMVKSLLSLARQDPAEEQVLQLNQLLREVATLLERTTLSRVSLALDLEAELRPMCGDPSSLTNTFMNLCVNAVDAMSERGTLSLRTRNLEGNRIEVTVTDTGCGMPQEVLAKALDPFFTTKPQGKGTGLGLSIAYSTVKAHKGEMQIQSEEGRGTSVQIRFPALRPVVAPEAEPPLTSDPAPRTGRLSVLVVDDDELIRRSSQDMLDHLGHDVVTASSGEEALALLEEGLRPDVVLLDVNMPGLGGAETLPPLRVLCPRTPVLLATGRVDQTTQQLLDKHPDVTLLPKPFSKVDLQRHLDPFLKSEAGS